MFMKLITRYFCYCLFDNFQVIIRVRPLSSSEISLQGRSSCVRQESSQTITWTGHPESRFTFDIVADENVSQVHNHSLYLSFLLKRYFILQFSFLGNFNRKCFLKLLGFQWWRIAWKGIIVACLLMGR